MLTHEANGETRFSFWPRVREFAVPASMIETATARRLVGDWAGACAAAGFDVDLDLRSLARTHGRDAATRIRSDLRHLAPDLLRWHMPRIAPDGLLRPGLTLPLARYELPDRDGPPGHLHLVARTAPAWADGGQRIGLALWDAATASPLGVAATARHPHPRPSRRFRLDLHRHLWDARRAGELRARSGADAGPADLAPDPPGQLPSVRAESTPAEAAWAEFARVAATLGGAGPEGADPTWEDALGFTNAPRRAYGLPWAVERWEAEARILLAAEGPSGEGPSGEGPCGPVGVRAAGRRLVLDLGPAPGAVRIADAPRGGTGAPLPVLPDAATRALPDLELLRAGAIEADRLHPLVAAALVPGFTPPAHPSPTPHDPGRPRIVECRGALHGIALVDGVLSPLDHEPAELRREELLVALGGPPLPCLRAIDATHRRPDALDGVRDRLAHGDTAGALAVVEGLLGPEAVLRDGPLRDALEDAARRRIAYGLYRTGLSEPPRSAPRVRATEKKAVRTRPRLAVAP
ncbi:hypothetical protein ACIRQF_21875 [Streptomyces sp. NPDC101191]|uniref:hypothetical protein n=1 Tax=Streptomyces sp. NPDC101191 TaxID=3366126 RepID=UPI0037F525BE